MQVPNRTQAVKKTPGFFLDVISYFEYSISNMKNPSDLSLLALAVIQHRPTGISSRYQVMIEINHTTAWLLPPYSPGGVYQVLRLLAADEMIIINQSVGIQITPIGLQHLHEHLLDMPMPAPLLPLLLRIVAIALLTDTKKRSVGVRKVQIEMIKFDPLSPEYERQRVVDDLSPINKLLFLGQAARQSILGFVAQI
jgi:DNA-binding PadR family transcriptional regulator